MTLQNYWPFHRPKLFSIGQDKREKYWIKIVQTYMMCLKAMHKPRENPSIKYGLIIEPLCSWVAELLQNRRDISNGNDGVFGWCTIWENDDGIGGGWVGVPQGRNVKQKPGDLRGRGPSTDCCHLHIILSIFFQFINPLFQNTLLSKSKTILHKITEVYCHHLLYLPINIPFLAV